MAGLPTLRKTDPVQAAEAALGSLQAKRAELVIEIERLTAREGEIEEEGELLKVMAGGKARRNRLSKLDAKVAEAEGAVARAKAEARERRRRELLAAFDAAVSVFVSQAKAMRDAFALVVKARSALEAEGFRDEASALPVPGSIGGSPLVSPEIVALFEERLKPKVQQSIARHPVRMTVPRAAAAPPPPKAPPQAPPRLSEPAGEGQARYTVVRNGLELPGRRQLRIGDIIALTDAEAVPLVRNSAVVAGAKELPQL